MDSFTPVLRFIASSDIHTNSNEPVRIENFKKGLMLAKEYASNQPYDKIDAIVANGDFADRGEEEQMICFKKAVDDSPIDAPLLVNLASHEFMSEGEEAAIEKYTRVFGHEPDMHLVINGFHFIAVSCTNGCRFDDKKRRWVKENLASAAADDPCKPIFFFQHPHVSGTVYGSIDWGEDDLNNILTNYPQIIDFSGHSHAPVNDPRSIHQKHFTSVGTGSFSYFELDEYDKIYGTVPPDEDFAAQFVICEADAGGRVRLRPFDVYSQRFFDGCDWFIEKPWEPDSFVYTDERYFNSVKPHFPDDTAIEINTQGNDAVLTFSQADGGNERVNDYTVTVRRKKDGLVERRFAIWSRYYLNDMPHFLTQKIEDLPSGEYTLSIRARGFWMNGSDNTVQKDFEIKGE